MKILVACEFSGVVRDAFARRGHDAWSCDLEPSEMAGQHIQDDVIKHLYEGWDLMIAHPPCTYLSTTGNKWFKPEYRDRFPERLSQRHDAICFIWALVYSGIPRIAIENPVGILSTVWRKPDQYIQPFQFGHPEPKKTCLWLKGLPDLMPTKIVDPEYFMSKSGKRLAKWYFQPSQTPERQKLRNRTFLGIAEAMAEQWGGEVRQGSYVRKGEKPTLWTGNE
ncbi:hypothetical protein LCGC14_0853130 [marine sediment metagenome]|uniref:DNA cytosine methyltransferase n=1 Tax=marine sediment metagenome TaxID=412755 RepID=A0A0F9RU65_9ZZZZ